MTVVHGLSSPRALPPLIGGKGGEERGVAPPYHRKASETSICKVGETPHPSLPPP